MKLKVLVVALLLLCCDLAVALVPQGASPKGRIEGTVLKAGSNDPLPGVRVNVNRVTNYSGPIAPGGVLSMSTSAVGPPPPPPVGARGGVTPPVPTPIPTVITDRDGKFVIPDLDEGPYRVSVVAPGYVRQQYKGVLTLAAGQVMTNVDVLLTLAGNVSGRLRDSFGQPASGVPIQLLKPSYNESGQKGFQQVGQTRTNDRGEYRIYWVTPGRYYVAAGSPPGPAGGSVGGPAPFTPNDPGDSYLLTYYPGVADIATANSVDVTSGGELNVDFVLPRQQTYTIRGRVFDTTTNQSPPSIRLSLSFAMITGGGASWSMIAPYTASTGVFEIRDIVPGSYSLEVSSQGSVARLPLDVTNNIDGLPVLLNGTAGLSGRIVMDGLDQTGVERLRVSLSPNNNAGLRGASAVANADGTLKLENLLPGEYRVGVSGIADYFIKDARFDRNDVLNQPMKLSSNIPGGASLEVVVSNKVGQIDGIVTDQKQQPVVGVLAVLVPDKRNRTELFKTSQTDRAGRFTLQGIAPGDYKLFSWESIENYGYFDPDLLKQADALGKPVHVAESSKVQADIRVIPAR